MKGSIARVAPGEDFPGCLRRKMPDRSGSVGMSLQIWTCSHFASVTEVMDFFLSPLLSMGFPTGRDTELHI